MQFECHAFRLNAWREYEMKLSLQRNGSTWKRNHPPTTSNMEMVKTRREQSVSLLIDVCDTRGLCSLG